MGQHQRDAGGQIHKRMNTKADQDTGQYFLMGNTIAYDETHGCVAGHGQKPFKTSQCKEQGRGGRQLHADQFQLRNIHTQSGGLGHQMIEIAGIDHHDIDQIVYIGHTHQDHGFDTAVAQTGCKRTAESESLMHELGDSQAAC